MLAIAKARARKNSIRLTHANIPDRSGDVSSALIRSYATAYA